jgi:acyl-CoA synthetase (AMP-forming)/AMP-acid ligase II
MLGPRIATLDTVVRADQLHAEGGTARDAGPPAKVGPEDLGLIQYTSGSTGDPKGVTLTHANLISNVRAIGEAVEVGADDVVVSWLPLYHDMGLIGCWFFALCTASGWSPFRRSSSCAVPGAGSRP